ncbi:NLR, CARD domain-containing protein 3 [Phytophthora pseudosyringae]|uniref:NLR, CARD domain-containing protein 3 n=1 Tax=Phytophthora pseudosyringae TaxID=221518 RepID=A0A8T1VBU0_9STRA|nr:NLR, CARD domain-containing protein 3 [Phytophthora pseudosyringae]
MKQVGSFRESAHHRRRSRQSFRSQELLASLTVSAEAITLRNESGNPEEAAARAASRQTTRRSTTKVVRRQSPARDHAVQDVVSVSNAKIMTMKRLKSMCKYRLAVHGSLRESDEEADEGVNTHGLPIKASRKSLVPINPAFLPGILLPSPTRTSPTNSSHEKHAIGNFETSDSKWKATIEGEVERFMYPSLRLETLYSQEEWTPPNPREGSNDNKPMPSPKTIDDVLTCTSKVSWELEHVAPSPLPVTPVQQVDSKRLRFDQKLQDAEALLRKREAASMRLNTAPPGIDVRKSGSLDTVAVELETSPAISSQYYEESDAPRQQPIPRLPQARKLIKEIQRYTTNAGQIAYYADKQHLFTKWKKVQASQHHQQLSPIPLHKLQQESHHDEEEDDGDLEPEVDDGSTQPFGKLSPRSLFYDECVKNQILPEPIFSRINDVAAPYSQPPTARLAPASPSFAAVASTLVSTRQKSSRPGRGKRLLALQLQQFGLGDAKIIALSKSLRGFQAIQVLDLSDNRLTDASIIPLLQALTAPPCDTQSADNRSPKAKLLAAAASQTCTRDCSERSHGGCLLTVLNLSKNELGRKGCEQIARFLATCRTLTFLDLSHTTLGGDDEAFAPVAAAIESHPSLKRVNLSHNSIGERGGTLLGEMLTNPACVVRALDVSWNSIRRSGAVALGVAMRTNTSLTTLHMSMNRCGDGGGEQLAAALACNTTLTQLDLSHNALTGASAVAFGFFLRQNQSLRVLDMKDNSLGQVGARALLRAIALGSRCEMSLSVHDLEASTVGSTAAASSSSIFDAGLPSASSPFELRMGESPYAFAVASELIDAALIQGRCALSELSYEGGEIPRSADTARSRLGRSKSANKKRFLLAVDQERRCLYNVADSSKAPWKLPARGTLRATATFMAPPLPRGPLPWLEEESCLGLIQIVKRGFSSRDTMSLLDLVLADLQLTTSQASFFVSHLQQSLPKMELLGRLWPCLIDGENAFAFLQEHLTQSEQWRLINRFGPVLMQFSTANPTGHWTLTLRDPRHRKLAIWFASLNAHHTAIVARFHPKRTDCSQYGRGFHWRNVVFNQKRIQLTYAFFDRLPRDGVLEFDYASPLRPADRYLEENHLEFQDGVELDQAHIQSTQVAMPDEELATLLSQVGAEVCAIYVPVHKRQNLKYHLVLFHLAIAARRVLTRQAHHVLQHFPKNYESGRLRALVAMHHAIVDLEYFGELLERLAVTDRPRVYVNLGYLHTVMPLALDMDFEVDFTREDEKMLLRALVDLSISCPMDMIRIDSTRSTVLIIYSMYQTNTVPATGRICFRYVTHQGGNRLDWLRARQQTYRHFLCGDRLKSLNDSTALALAASAGSNDTTTSVTVGGASTNINPTESGNSATTPA